MIPHDDPRRLIARLAIAVIAADRHVTSEEIAALDELDHLGLGRLSGVAREEMLRAVEEPIDLTATCEGLVSVPDHHTGEFILSALARLASCDRRVTVREVDLLCAIGARLGVPGPEVARIVGEARAACGNGGKPVA